MTQDGMWQDSGRYEWPLLPVPPGPGMSSADIVLDARPYPERADAENAALKRQVEALRARVAELEQGRDGRTL